MIKSEVKQRWLRALRNRHFKQARGTWFDPNESRFCCMGVLCKLENERQSYAGAKTLGLTINQIEKLIVLNDDKEFSFPKIADYIEKNIGART